MPKNWSIGEPGSVYDYLEENDDEIEFGDTIEYISNNQMGYVKYKVVLDEDGKKGLDRIADYDSWMEEMDRQESQEEAEPEPEPEPEPQAENEKPREEEKEQKGGKRKDKKSKTRKKIRSSKKSLTRSKKVTRRRKSMRRRTKKY